MNLSIFSSSFLLVALIGCRLVMVRSTRISYLLRLANQAQMGYDGITHGLVGYLASTSQGRKVLVQCGKVVW